MDATKNPMANANKAEALWVAFVQDFVGSQVVRAGLSKPRGAEMSRPASFIPAIRKPSKGYRLNSSLT